MKKAFNCLFLLTVLFGASIFAQTTIAVIDLEGIGISKDETNLLTNRLRNELVKTKAFRVVERQEMSKILKEQKFQASGCTSTECAVEIGQLLGVERIVMGSIGMLGNMYTISSRMVDVESAELISVSDYDYEGNITGLLKFGMKYIAQGLAEGKLSSNQSQPNKTNKTSPPKSIPISIDEELLDDLTFEKTDLDIVDFKAWDAPPTPSGPPVKFIPYDDPPVPLTPIRPKYPKVAQEAGIEGTVFAQAFIDKKGRVKEINIIKGIPNTGLDEAAIEAIRKTRFRPAKQRGKAVGVWISIPINYKLKG